MQGILRNKKGLSPQTLQSVAFIIALIGISIGVGVWINQELYETTISTTAVSNESVSLAANNTYYALVYRAQAITGITNATNTLPSSQYTSRTYGDLTQVVMYDNVTFVVGTWNISYTSYQGTDYLVITNATAGMSALSQWLPIIMVVIAAGVVIGVLVLWFSGRRGGL